ncbi:MAG TPA: hypothetical protein VGJ20_19435 [Xanthobacteraceae bacterium]|jgi:hypothetical protein
MDEALAVLRQIQAVIEKGFARFDREIADLRREIRTPLHDEIGARLADLESWVARLEARPWTDGAGQ